MSACCTLRLKRRRALSRDSPSCRGISAKQTHPQTRPEGPNSYYKDFTRSQVGTGDFLGSESHVSWFFETQTRPRRPDPLRNSPKTLKSLSRLPMKPKDTSFPASDDFLQQ